MATALVGALNWDESTDVSDEIFFEATENEKKELNDKLHIIKTALLGGNIYSASQGNR